MKIKETLLSGIYIEAEKTKKYLENSKLLLSVICIEPEIGIQNFGQFTMK